MAKKIAIWFTVILPVGLFARRAVCTGSSQRLDGRISDDKHAGIPVVHMQEDGSQASDGVRDPQEVYSKSTARL